MQEAQAREAVEAVSSSAPPAMLTAQQADNAKSSTTGVPGTIDEEEHLLQRALMMSERQDINMEGVDMDEDEDEDAAIARAIEMSMRGQAEDEDKDEDEDEKKR
jgi:26S proteasome regulatory subunit N10